MSFAELSCVINRSGAEYAYFLESYGPLHKFWGRLPAFICAWVYVFAIRPSTIAVIALTFAEYLIQPFLNYLCIEDPQIFAKKMVAVAAVGKFFI